MAALGAHRLAHTDLLDTLASGGERKSEQAKTGQQRRHAGKGSERLALAQNINLLLLDEGIKKNAVDGILRVALPDRVDRRECLRNFAPLETDMQRAAIEAGAAHAGAGVDRRLVGGRTHLFHWRIKREVGIRKAAGAGRGMLVAQFLGETVLQALFALCVAMALAEWSLPLVNGFMQSGAIFAWWRDPSLLASLLGGTVLVGTAAGLYPALVLSAFRPALVLKGLMLRGSAVGTRLRQGLVALQFAIPLALVIAAIVVFQQERFAATEAMRLDTDQMLMINLPACGTALDAEVSALPGVAGAACSGPSLLPSAMLLNHAKARDSRPIDLMIGEVGFGFFRLFRLPALAGRLPDPAHPGDAIPERPAPAASGGVLRATRPLSPRPATRYVINETAVQALGYASPADAIGKPLRLGEGAFATTDEIIGVVRDLHCPPQRARQS